MPSTSCPLLERDNSAAAWAVCRPLTIAELTLMIISNPRMQMLAATHGIERFRVKRDVPGLPGMPEMVMHQAHVFIGSV